MNNDAILKVQRAGVCDFENYWNEDLYMVVMVHYMPDILDSYPTTRSLIKLNNVAKGAVIHNAMSFSYSLGEGYLLDYWKLNIITESGEFYSSDGSLRCSIRDNDNHKVILGVNGESNSFYIHMSDSGSCSRKLTKFSDI